MQACNTSFNLYKIGTLSIPILQMGKLRHKVVRNQDLNAGTLASEPTFVTLIILLSIVSFFKLHVTASRDCH